MKIYTVLFLILMSTSLCNTETLYSQDSDFRHIRLFQSFFTDARVSESPYIKSKSDFSVISTGIDYFINRKGNIRINAIFGLDDGAPDIGGSFGLLVPF